MSKLDVVTVGPLHSPRAYVDRETGKPTGVAPTVLFGTHRFFETDDHQLGHEIDGVLRATVPPDGMKEYAELWPDCKDLVGQLRRGSSAKTEKSEKSENDG